MKNSWIISLLILLSVSGLYGQELTKAERRALRKARPVFLNLGFGIGASTLRDFATSPLIYKGSPYSGTFSRLRYDSLRETEIGINVYRGGFSFDYNDETARSAVSISDIYYTRLYKVNTFKNEKWNFKVGGKYSFVNDFRINPDLQNNSLGLDFISTLFVSAKITFDASRVKEKSKKCWFVRYHLKPRKRSLSFQVNTALINSALRNGYTYSGQAGVVNDISNIFDGYTFKLFSGYRMSSALNYTIWLRNKNRVRLSYVWDALKTGGPYESLEMAHHSFRFTFMFNTK